MSRKFPWLKLQKKSGVETPLRAPVWFGNRTNGEFWHDATPKERLMEKLVLERSEKLAKYHGMDRREFLASSAGMVATMAVINELGGCKDDGKTPLGADGSAATGDGPPYFKDNAPYLVKPVKGTCDPADRLTGDEFIFDIQTHSFDDGEWRQKNPSYSNFLTLLGGSCTEPNRLDCFSLDHYADLMFLQSDTTVSVISSWPANTCTDERTNGCGLPLSNEGMRALRDKLNGASQSQRVVNQVQIMPNDDIELQKQIMTMAAQDPDWRAVSWKAYPAWRSDTYKPNGSPSGYFMTDDIGTEFIEHGLSLGLRNFAIHKGLPIPGFDVEHNQPTDIGPIAKMYPNANFIIYHSGISSGCMSGCGAANERAPFDPSNQKPLGMDMLIKSAMDSGLVDENGPTGKINIFPELGSAWSNVMTDAVAAQHFIGKLLKFFGEDNVCWGTDSILAGSPQVQIEMFRSFTITESFREQFGYPELTDTVKRKIFGLNAAKIFRVNPDDIRCKLDKNALAMRRIELDGEFGGRRWTQLAPHGPRTRREFITAARAAIKKGQPGIA
jgi:hypothetical protein